MWDAKSDKEAAHSLIVLQSDGIFSPLASDTFILPMLSKLCYGLPQQTEYSPPPSPFQVIFLLWHVCVCAGGEILTTRPLGKLIAGGGGGGRGCYEYYVCIKKN